MPAPYSLDLRERVLRAVDESPLMIEEVAVQFNVSERVIYRWLALRKQTGSVAPKPHGGGRRAGVDETGGKLLGEWVEEQNDRTLDEYIELYEQKRAVRLSRSAMHRALVRLNLPRKKKLSALGSRTARM
jgi:transposase